MLIRERGGFHFTETRLFLNLYAHTESNRNQENRNLSFYPLNYGRVRTETELTSVRYVVGLELVREVRWSLSVVLRLDWTIVHVEGYVVPRALVAL